jgi:hypothetical protein
VKAASKTGRKWGVILSELRAWIREHRQFTVDEIPGPGARRHLKARLQNLERRGEIRRVRPGTPGHLGIPSVWTAASANPQSAIRNPQ